MGSVQFNYRTGGRGIEWADVTINPVGGCRHACRWRMPDGRIARCYAESVAEGVARASYPDGFSAHYWRPGALKEMRAAGPPQFIFIDSMSDLMGSWVSEDEIRQVFAAMRDGAHNTFQALTKNPRRYLKFADELPGNMWCGASSAPDFFMGKELTPAQQERYMHVALETLAAVRERTGNIVWMSIEPLSWDVAPILAQYPALDWAVIGAASDGPRYFQPDPVHVDRVLDVLDRDETAVFYKGNIKATFDLYDFGTAAKNRWREDFPVRPVEGRDGRPGVPGPAPAVARRQAQARLHGWTRNTFLTDETGGAGAPAVSPDATPAAAQLALFG